MVLRFFFWYQDSSVWRIWKQGETSVCWTSTSLFCGCERTFRCLEETPRASLSWATRQVLLASCITWRHREPQVFPACNWLQQVTILLRNISPCSTFECHFCKWYYLLWIIRIMKICIFCDMTPYSPLKIKYFMYDLRFSAFQVAISCKSHNWNLLIIKSLLWKPPNYISKLRNLP